jgi:hypothetical protein
MKSKKPLKIALVVVVAALVIIQVIPYGRAHTNPPVREEPQWDDPQTGRLVRTACYDCHSNETRWPWYAHIAPVSWLVQHDVDEARSKLNFSEWDRPQNHAFDAAQEVREGEMPPLVYLLGHGDARLSEADKNALIRGLVETMRGANRAWQRE